MITLRYRLKGMLKVRTYPKTARGRYMALERLSALVQGGASVAVKGLGNA